MDKPILFSGAMVRAVLEGRKTQTRRVINTQPRHRLKQGPLDAHWYDTDYECVGHVGRYVKCPYGQPGDRLWVRETWKCEELFPSGLDGVRFAADGAFIKIENTEQASDAWGEANRKGGKWRPSIFMPRWASRITLDLLRVRVERVQEINRADAKAEGVSNIWSWDEARNAKHPEHFRRAVLNPYVANYSVLWDEINAKRGFSWDANPWVWVVEFKVVTK